MKIFKSKNFKALIYSIFLSLPILTILGRTIYTIANKNAKDSYYGETINEQQTIKTETIKYGENYYFYNDSTTTTINLSTQINFTMTSIQNITINAGYNLNENVNNGFIYFNSGQGKRYIAFREDTNSYTYIPVNLLSFEFVNLTTSNGDLLPYLYQIEYNKYSYLDNAFEYSIDRFVEENNYGKLNFFQWFSDLFLNNNQTNNLYIHFINWYMNYILYVSLAYLLFAVLMWFVNFFRSLVEKNMDLDL